MRRDTGRIETSSHRVRTYPTHAFYAIHAINTLEKETHLVRTALAALSLYILYIA